MTEEMEILKKTEVLEKSFTNTSMLITLICAGGTLAFLIVAVIDSFKRIRHSGLSLILFGVALLFATAGALSIHHGTKLLPTGRYEYEVILDESVDMTDIYKHYEVVSVKGDIYILRDLKPTESVCENCNTHIDNTDKFCPECGTKLTSKE